MTYPNDAVCPCCRFATLNEGGMFEVCPICWWEDDGQGDSNADEAGLGPNDRYSLSEARRNFAAHGHMYARGEGVGAVEQPSAERAALVDYLASVGFDAARADEVRLAELLDAEHRRMMAGRS